MFSKFYTDGEGLDPVSLSYAGEAAPLNTSGPTLSPAQWDSKAKYDDGVHQLLKPARTSSSPCPTDTVCAPQLGA